MQPLLVSIRQWLQKFASAALQIAEMSEAGARPFYERGGATAFRQISIPAAAPSAPRLLKQVGEGAHRRAGIVFPPHRLADG